MKKNLLTSLKELLEALGGKKSNQTNIVGVVDEIVEQVKEKDSSSSGVSGSIYLDLNKLPKPTIDNVEYNEVNIFFQNSDSEESVIARILDVESIEQFPPMILYETQNDDMGRPIMCQYSSATYVIDLVHGIQQSQVISEGEGSPCLVSDTDIECCVIYCEYEQIVLFPSSAQFGLMEGK